MMYVECKTFRHHATESWRFFIFIFLFANLNLSWCLFSTDHSNNVSWQTTAGVTKSGQGLDFFLSQFFADTIFHEISLESQFEYFNMCTILKIAAPADYFGILIINYLNEDCRQVTAKVVANLSC